MFVRELDPVKAQRLVKITRTAKDSVRLPCAGIVLASVQGRSAAEAAAMFAATAQYAREVIHAFNQQGFAALDPKWSGGRPCRFGPHAREVICRVARAARNRAEQRWLEAHERWAYDAKRSVQSLRRLVCLCSDCHRTTHYGLAEVQGTADQAFRHLRVVNGLSAAQAKSHIADAVDLWRARSLRTWTLDLTILASQGIEIVPP